MKSGRTAGASILSPVPCKAPFDTLEAATNAHWLKLHPAEVWVTSTGQFLSVGVNKSIPNRSSEFDIYKQASRYRVVVAVVDVRENSQQ